jgi:hypothetical protein
LKVPLVTQIQQIEDIPYTVSYIVRKRQQVDNINELPEDKRPPELMIWDGTVDEIESWINNSMSGKQSNTADIYVENIEG